MRWRRLSLKLPSGERCRRVGYKGAATFHGAPGIPQVLPALYVPMNLQQSTIATRFPMTAAEVANYNAKLTP
jgi:hypothetical protein